MNDLPAPPSGANPSTNKEQETGMVTDVPFRPAGEETEVSPEVVASGVKVQPTTIPIPSAVSAMGVRPAGQNIPPADPAVSLPLSDDQIAQGLKQSVWSSWRWLAQWCIRRLKQVHMGLKSIHGRLTRVRQ
jgi:hypothetical protein